MAMVFKCARWITGGLCFVFAPVLALGEAAPTTLSSVSLILAREAEVPPSSAIRIPNWSGGALVSVDDSNQALPLISTFGRDGTLLTSGTFTIPGAARNLLRAFKRASDGSLALVGSAQASDSRGALYLARIPADSGPQQIFRLNAFYPYDVAIAPDGTYWVVGEEVINGEEGSPHHNVIRRFGASGQELGGYLPRSTMTVHGCCHPADDSFLVSSRDRIGWYSNTAREYIEFSPDGRQLIRVAGLAWDGRSRVSGLGLCEDGGVFVSFAQISSAASRPEIFTLDRVSGGWKVAPRSGDATSVSVGLVYGCDGNEVVARARLPNGLLRLIWLRPVAAP